MPSDRRTFDRLRAQARQAREVGDYRQAARLERQAAEWAGAQGLAGSQARALLWEGYSLRQAGEDDLALASLLEAVNDRAAADPADIFSALTAILHISLEHKPFRFCRTLLDQTRDWLFELRRPWSAPLDFLEGELALRRGEFAAAWDWHSRAWAGWRDEHPCLTPATHLWALCRTAFRLDDPAALERLTEQLVSLDPTQSLERHAVQRARLLLFRKTCSLLEQGWWKGDQPLSLVDLALNLLVSITDEVRDSGARREALRVLALVGRWPEIDEALSRRSLETGRFENQLLLGDLAMNRIRLTSGLSTVDDDANTRMICTAKPITGQVSPAMLDQAKQHYQEARWLADQEDERLETRWHSDTVCQRQSQLAFVTAHR